MYKTDSMQLAAFLIASGYELKSYPKENNRITFIFDNENNNIDEFSKRFFMGEKVNAISFWNAIKNLKALIYQ